MIKLLQETRDLDQKAVRLVVDHVYQALKEDKHDVEFDLEFGTLAVYIDQDEISFKFKPSDLLVKKLDSKFSQNRQLVIKDLETKVISKFLEPVEELL